jgi:rhodanese-related sulfurtransferase
VRLELTSQDIDKYSMVIWLSRLFVGLMNLVAPLLGRARVGDVDTDELARRLDGRDESFVLVDVRSDEEVGVSMIPGAITRDQFAHRRDELAGKLVIAYCTVGGRSLLFAQQCAKDGFEVLNYRGSILEWCAAGRPLVTPDGSPTRRVHTHSRVFDVPRGYQRVC